MSFDPQKYERRTFVVEAVQVSRENMPQVIQWSGGTLLEDDLHRPYISIDVNRPMNPKQTMAYEGDWVLKTSTGFRIYTNHAFDRSFERTEKPLNYGTNKSSPDPYQTGGNVFDRPDVDRKVVVERPVGDEKDVQPESVEQITLDVHGAGMSPRTEYELGHPGEPEGFKTPYVRGPEEIREAHRVGGSEPRRSFEEIEAYREDFFRQHGRYPGIAPDSTKGWFEPTDHAPTENPDNPHA